jgi:hypothetical protein
MAQLANGAKPMERVGRYKIDTCNDPLHWGRIPGLRPKLI